MEPARLTRRVHLRRAHDASIPTQELDRWLDRALPKAGEETATTRWRFWQGPRCQLGNGAGRPLNPPARPPALHLKSLLSHIGHGDFFHQRSG